ncbi:MAG: hypothetical protein ACXQT5_04410, partial [Candidatus Syntropharchaeia archaeon]
MIKSERANETTGMHSNSFGCGVVGAFIKRHAMNKKISLLIIGLMFLNIAAANVSTAKVESKNLFESATPIE